MKATPKLSISRPSSSARPAGQTSRAAAKYEEGERRLVVELPLTLHRRLKAKAAERGETMKAYVLRLLEAEGLAE